MIQSLLKTEIRNETDVVSVRRKARDISQFLGLDVQAQTRVATAVSEIARNAFEYARGGLVEYRIEQDDVIRFVVVIKDKGPGIQKLQEILRGTYVSPQGMGLGLLGAKKLMDEVDIETKMGEGSTVTLKKIIPHRKMLLSSNEVRELTDKIMGTNSNDPMAELQRQNQEILIAMAELREKKEELIRINQELEDTNRGVVALYAELDEKAEILRRANESKTSFLADMTHEFRSPLNSILGISQILLTESRRDLAPEREKQVNFIMKAARGLSDLVNDLLDIAKIEAGKITVKTSHFQVNELMSTLRGLMRPLSMNDEVNLVFNISENFSLHTDEAKLTQILRNFISNALKYTNKGEIVVSAADEGERVIFSVKDTGMGIPEKDQKKIFEEFYQVDHEQQDKSKGTGLGLPLTKKLARLLGGEISLESQIGVGSEFKLKIPKSFTGPSEAVYEPKAIDKSVHHSPSRKKVLVVDDDESVRYQVRSALAELNVDFREAINGKQGIEVAKVYLPDLIILDLVMPEKDGFQFIRDAMENVATRHIPILLNTSKKLDYEERIYLEQVTSGIIEKIDGQVDHLQRAVKSILGVK
jgi:signal transduction histidine kinase/CheY-like chemotaxis protein